SVSQIERLIWQVNDKLRADGFITSSAYLDEQDISTGSLTISIFTGKIETITLDGKQPRILTMVFPQLIEKPLNLRDLEQGLEQLNRLTTQRIDIDIEPGQKNGYSAIVLRTVTARWPVSATLSFDNSGQQST